MHLCGTVSTLNCHLYPIHQEGGGGACSAPGGVVAGKRRPKMAAHIEGRGAARAGASGEALLVAVGAEGEGDVGDGDGDDVFPAAASVDSLFNSLLRFFSFAFSLPALQNSSNFVLRSSSDLLAQPAVASGGPSSRFSSSTSLISAKVTGCVR